MTSVFLPYLSYISLSCKVNLLWGDSRLQNVLISMGKSDSFFVNLPSLSLDSVIEADLFMLLLLVLSW